MAFMTHRPDKDANDDHRGPVLTRMVSLAKVSAWLCRVGAVLASLPLVAITFLMVDTHILQDALAGTARVTSPGLGAVLLESADGFSSVTLITEQGYSAFASLTLPIVMAWALWEAGSLLASIARTQRPFERLHARKLGIVGMVLAIGSLTINIVGNVLTFALLKALSFTGSLSFSRIIEPEMLVVGLCILVFARIFDYGCILQEQDDGLL